MDHHSVLLIIPIGNLLLFIQNVIFLKEFIILLFQIKFTIPPPGQPIQYFDAIILTL